MVKPYRTPALVQQLVDLGYSHREIEAITQPVPPDEVPDPGSPPELYVDAKLPPHNLPPFYARPVHFCAITQIVGGDPPQVFGVRWFPFADATTGLSGNTAMDATGITQAEPVPEGQAVIITRAECFVGRGQDTSNVVAQPARQTRWSLFQTGKQVPGFANVPPTSSFFQTDFTAGTVYSVSPARSASTLHSYIRVNPRETLSIEFRDLSGVIQVTWDFVAHIAGWMLDLPRGDGRTPFVVA